MTKEVKFRALVKYRGLEADWIYYGPRAIPYAFNPNEKDSDVEIIVKDLEYTGCKDKNKKDIYAGDKLRKRRKTYWLYKTVEWHSSRNFAGYWNLGQPEQWEIIGNIYESV